jgi:choline monooxygenase
MTTNGALLRDFLSETEVANLFAPAGQAIGLPGRAYGAGFYELERRHLFPKLWCAVGFGSDIPNAGDAMPVELAGWPLVIVRGSDGCVRAFHNICRHRAMKLVGAPSKGRSALVCPWHAWTYDLDGKLLATPRIGGETQASDPAFDTRGLDLKAVAAGEWHDLVFVNIDGKAKPLAEHMKPLDALLSNCDFADLRRADDQFTLAYPGNWKVSVEGAIEDYHIPWGHPQLNKGAKRGHFRLDYAPDCFYSNSTIREYTQPGEADAANTQDARLPNILKPDPSGGLRTLFLNIFPTGAVQTRGNFLLLGLMLPDGAARTRLRFNAYFKGEAATDPSLTDLRAQATAAWKLVLEQDIDFVRDVHENYMRRDDAGIETRVAPFWETNVLQFQRNVVECLRTNT